MKNRNLVYTLLLATTIIACNSSNPNTEESITPNENNQEVSDELVMDSKVIQKSNAELEIDNFVESISIHNNTYDITQSLRFSTETTQYDVEAYTKEKEIHIYLENYTDSLKGYQRELYFKNGTLVYVKESGYDTSIDSNGEDYEIESYIINNKQVDYKRVIIGSDTSNYAILPTLNNYDLNRPKQAINQKGDFEMRFGEFLIIKPQSYLILENKESKYNVALYIINGDPLLDNLYTNPEQYKGKIIFAKHEFSIIGGAERMVYLGAKVIE